MTHPLPTRRSSDLLELLVALDVHEHVGAAVVVEVLHGAAVDRRGLDLGAGVEGLVDGLVGLDVLQLGAHEGRRSVEHTSELQSLMRNSYAVFCLTKNNNYNHILCQRPR